MNVAKLAYKFHRRANDRPIFARLEKVNLRFLLKQVVLYERLRVISFSERVEVERIVDYLE